MDSATRKATVVSYETDTGNGIISDHLDGRLIATQKSNLVVKDNDDSINIHLYPGEHVQYILKKGIATNVTGMQAYKNCKTKKTKRETKETKEMRFLVCEYCPNALVH